jgi:dTDP-4-dehydrorhamnose 3,5-epimerase
MQENLDPLNTQMCDVLVIPLKKVVNARGHLMEIQRNDDEHFMGFGQAYVTNTLPGVIKAWYLHHEQWDQITPVCGKAKAVLFDARPHSPTHGLVLEVWLNEEAPVLLRIPPGVWHGHMAVGDQSVYLLHLNSVPYRFDHVDEDRLDPDSSLIPYKW